MTLSVVWFKRDLRISDHAPLSAAAGKGPVLPIYVIEPEYWQQPDSSLRQWLFVRESLLELNEQLNRLGQPLWVVGASIEAVLAELLDNYPGFELYSHQETGNQWSRQRDRGVEAWCRKHGIAWHQFQSHGVIRGLSSRSGWTERWQDFMDCSTLSPPARLPFVTVSPLRPEIWPEQLGADGSACSHRQNGGRRAGLETLRSFLKERGGDYRQFQEHPVQAFAACSRLGPYLSQGILSMREVVQQTRRAHRHYRAKGDDTWADSLAGFMTQLHRRCHSIQMLEDEPELETRCLHRSFEGLRPETPDSERLQAWCEGRTGYPLIDAAMRALNTTGWLSCNLRGLLISFACHQLWLHWREPALHLARMSVDYDPGILFPQVQMQAGTTGIHPWRFQDPVIQAQKLDPEGRYVKAGCRELRELEGGDLYRPWTMMQGQQLMMSCVLGRDYPHPIVEQAGAIQQATRHLQQHLDRHYDPRETRRVTERHASPTYDKPWLDGDPATLEDAQGYLRRLLD